MNRIVISVMLLGVVYAMSGCVGTVATTTLPTSEATGVVPAMTRPAPAPTVGIAQPTPANPIQPTRGLKSTPRPQIPPPIDTNPTRPVETMIPDPTLLKLVNQAKTDLAQRANVLSDEIKVKSTEAIEWRDASLGCPKPGMMYAQVITPGYLIVLETAGQEWRYHASTTHVEWCDK